MCCSQSARITLTGRTMELLPGFEDVGFKVLAAAGGQINFYGQLFLTKLKSASDLRGNTKGQPYLHPQCCYNYDLQPLHVNSLCAPRAGMPSGPSTPSWVSLTQPAAAGETVLNVDQNVTGWPVGGTVSSEALPAIASPFPNEDKQ